MRKRRRNSERNEMIVAILLMLLVVLIVFTPFLADRYNYKNAQHIFNKRAEQYNKNYTVTVYHVRGGETVYSISSSLYEEYGKEYDLTERDIYYGIRSINDMEEKVEASCIYAGSNLFIPYIKWWEE